jgi:hypothetical protein
VIHCILDEDLEKCGTCDEYRLNLLKFMMGHRTHFIPERLFHDQYMETDHIQTDVKKL